MEIPPQATFDRALTLEGYIIKEHDFYQVDQNVITKVEITSNSDNSSPNSLEIALGYPQIDGSATYLRRGNVVTCSVEISIYDQDLYLEDNREIEIATLPEGYRPSMLVYNQAITASANHTGALMRIDTEGNIYLDMGSSRGSSTKFDDMRCTLTYVVP